MEAKAFEREDLLWELNDRIEDVRHFKRDQWQFAYAAIGAEAAILVLMLATPVAVTLFHRVVATAAAIGIFLLWYAAHWAIVRSLSLARTEIHALRKALGGGFQVRASIPDFESPLHRRRLVAVPTAISLAAIGATALTLVTAWGVGTSWAGFPAQSQPVGKATSGGNGTGSE